MARLENWSVVDCPDPYRPPEKQRFSLAGVVYDHPCLQDGVRIKTSAVLLTEGRLVMTASGTSYTLGTVDPDYRLWVDSNHPGLWNDSHPVRVLCRQRRPV